MGKGISILINLIFISFFILGPLYSLYAQDIPLEGFILDQTKTRVGRDFYDAFVQRWEYIPGLEGYDIIINELTDPRWGTQIYIYVADTLVYVTPLKPRLEDIDLKAEEAVQAVFDYFIFLQKVEKKPF